MSTATKIVIGTLAVTILLVSVILVNAFVG